MQDKLEWAGDLIWEDNDRAWKRRNLKHTRELSPSVSHGYCRADARVDGDRGGRQ